MDKRSLECFVVLAEELHFNRAAERCHISQPGMSQQLRRLEDQLEVQLLVRSNRQVLLTRAGQIFLDEARKLLKRMEEVKYLTQEMDQGVVGHLRVGATASALFILMPDIIDRFRLEFPHVHLEVKHLTTSEQEKLLNNNDIHVGICHPPLTDRSLNCELLAELPFDVVMSEHNPLANKSRLSFKDLANETFLIFPREIGPRLYDNIISLCHQQGFSPRRIVEVAPAQTIIAMAACDMGVGFTASKVQCHKREFATFRKLSGPQPYLTLGAAFSGPQCPSVMRRFIDIAKEVGAKVE